MNILLDVGDIIYDLKIKLYREGICVDSYSKNIKEMQPRILVLETYNLTSDL